MIEDAPKEAPGAVGIGTMTMVVLGLVGGMIFILDLTTLPRHLRFARRNLQDFKETITGKV